MCLELVYHSHRVLGAAPFPTGGLGRVGERWYRSALCWPQFRTIWSVQALHTPPAALDSWVLACPHRALTSLPWWAPLQQPLHETAQGQHGALPVLDQSPRGASVVQQGQK